MERVSRALVVDASVAVKWYAEEDETEKALRVRDSQFNGSSNLYAPDLIVYEVANALSEHPRITPRSMKSSVESLLELDIDMASPSSDLVIEAARIAVDLGVSVYDATYLALSDYVGASFVTADKRLFKRVKDEFSVFLLGDLGTSWGLP